jgi:hypothetical protein
MGRRLLQFAVNFFLDRLEAYVAQTETKLDDQVLAELRRILASPGFQESLER